MSYAEINKNFYIESTLIDDTTGESIDISEYIEDVMVRKRFYNESFPLYVVDLKTTEELRNKMRDDDIRIYLRISSFDLNLVSSQNEENLDVVPEDEVVGEITLRIYDKPFVTSVSKKDEDSDEEDGRSFSNSVPSIYYRVVGIPEDLIELNEKIINRIYNGAKLEEILVNIISEITENRRVEISEPTNKEEYRTLLIPPNTFISALDFLQEYYEVYKGTLSCFLDINEIDIFDPLNIKETNKINLDVKNINESPDGNEYKKILFDSEGNHLKFTLKSLPPFLDGRKIAADSVGSEVIHYSYDSFFNLVSRETENNEGFDKVRYHWNPTKKLSKEELLNSSLKRTVSMSIPLTGFNPELIRPSTLFTITSEYNIANGEYFPEVISYIFTSEDKKHYSVNMQVDCIKR